MFILQHSLWVFIIKRGWYTPPHTPHPRRKKNHVTGVLDQMSLGSLDKVVTTEDLCALNSPGSWKLKRQAEWAIAHKKSDKLPTHMRVHSKIVITCDSYIREGILAVEIVVIYTRRL